MKTEREQELVGSRLERAFFKVVVVSMDICDTALKKNRCNFGYEMQLMSGQ